MIRSSLSFRTPNGLAPLRHFALSFSLIACAFAVTGCSGKNINQDLRADNQILTREWTLPTRSELDAGDRGFDYSNPLLVENALIFGNRSTGLVSLYPGMVRTRWALPIPGGVWSEVVAEGNSLYFGGADGFLYSVNSETGRVNWRYEIRNTLISRPTFSGGRLFVTTSDDMVYAFDAGTGKWLWHYRRRTSPASTIHGASAPLVDGGEVLAGLSDGFLVGLGVDDGQLKWEKRLHQGNKFTDVDAQPVVDNGVVYVPSYDGALYAIRRKDHETLWRFDAGGSKRVLVEGQRVFLPSSDGFWYALDKVSGKVLWKFQMDGGTPTQLISTEQYLIGGSSYQYLYAVEKSSGRAVYRFNVGNSSGFSGSPAYDPSKKRVYILSGSGNLFAFAVRTPPTERRFGRIDGYEF